MKTSMRVGTDRATRPAHSSGARAARAQRSLGQRGEPRPAPKAAEEDRAPAPAQGFDLGLISILPRSAPPAPSAAAPAGLVQRKCTSCEGEDELQGGTIQRSAESGRGGGAASPGVGAAIAASHSIARPLEPSLRRNLERSFGRSLDSVRVATGEHAGRAADALSARAFTLGSTISFGRGEYRPDTADGRRLLAHEVAHVVQQATAGSSVQRELTVGRTDDPAEHAADRAADAVMRGEPVRDLSPAAPVVRRQARTSGPTTAPACSGQRTGDLTARVTCGDRTWEVTAVPVTGRRPRTTITAIPDIDGTNVWLDVTICRGGNEVTITPSVNLPQVVQQAVQQMISGGGLSGISVEPRAGIHWRLSRTLDATILGGPNVDLGTGQVTGGRLQGQVTTGPFGVGGFLDFGPTGRPTGGGLTGSYTPGQTTPAVDCSTQTVELQLRCRELTTTAEVPARPPTPEQHIPLDDQMYFFFEYAQNTLCRTATPTQARQTTCTRDGVPAQSQIDDLARRGARVTSITGYTSPEGPRGPSRRSGGFIGNDELSRRRAAAAGAWLQANAPQLISGTFATSGASELYTADERSGREMEGDRLTRQAVPRYLAGDRLAPTDPAEQARLRAMSPAQQRDAIYPDLRRAVVQFERVVPADPGAERVPPRLQRGDEGPCSDEVSRKAREVLRRT